MKKNIKGKYKLCDDFFPDEYRSILPINLFLLRVEIDNDFTFDNRFYIKSRFHKNDKRIGGEFYKLISNF